MAKIRNVSGQDLWVPWLNREVKADETTTVPDDHLDSYTSQPDNWADATTKKKGEN